MTARPSYRVFLRNTFCGSGSLNSRPVRQSCQSHGVYPMDPARERHEISSTGEHTTVNRKLPVRFRYFVPSGMGATSGKDESLRFESAPWQGYCPTRGCLRRQHFCRTCPNDLLTAAARSPVGVMTVESELLSSVLPRPGQFVARGTGRHRISVPVAGHRPPAFELWRWSHQILHPPDHSGDFLNDNAKEVIQ